MSLDMTAFAAYLKTKYPDFVPEQAVYSDNPLLAMVPKDENFGGESMTVPILHGNPQNNSSTFSTAIAGTSTSRTAKWLVTRTRGYGVITLDNETMEATEGNSHAFAEAFETEYEGAFNSLGLRLEAQLHGDGSGSIGQLSQANVGLSTLNLADPDQVVNFENGMVLQLAALKLGGAVRSGTVTVTGVNRLADSNQITLSGALSSGIAAAADGDYIFQSGDYGLGIKGLEAWIPLTEPSSGESFFGMDRSVDPSRLAGIRLDQTGVQIDEAIQKTLRLMAREGVVPDLMLCSYATFNALNLLLGTKVERSQADLSFGKFGFKALAVMGIKGECKIMPTRNCPNDRIYGITRKSWKFASLGKAPKLLNTDGLKMLRQASADGVELRAGYYAQLVCKAPGWNSVTAITPQ